MSALFVVIMGLYKSKGNAVFMKTMSIIGSTGSIGTQALEVAKKHNIAVEGLAALKNVELLAIQAKEFEAKKVCVFDETKKTELEKLLEGTETEILTGMDGLCEIARLDTDIFLNSVVGMVGLKPTVEALNAERTRDFRIALANKETLVAGGEIVMELSKKKNIPVLPVDSEHSAIFQCLQGNKKEQLRKIILTASGGPFFGKKKADIASASVEEALNHPNWSMGRKITIDSATLMNKGLEFIEAIRLFDVEPEQIEVVVHRESIVHSAVEYNDYSVIAQMGVPDMKIPIQYAVLYPERTDCPTKPLSLTDVGSLTFKKPDYETFDCLRACIEAVKMGKAMPAMVNGANEEAVAAFLDGRIKFLEIGELVSAVLDELENSEISTLEDVFEADERARKFVRERIERK